MIKRIKNILAVVYKNRRTTFAGILCAISTWLFSQQAISAEEFITLLGYCTTFVSLGTQPIQVAPISCDW